MPKIDDLPSIEDRRPAMTQKEWSFISRLNQTCTILARSKTRDEAVEMIAGDFNLDDNEAEKLLRKGEEYMASGAIESVDVAREMYHLRLMQIYDMAISNSQRDHVEVTQKPTRVVTDGGEFKIIKAEHVKYKQNVFDAAAATLAMKAAREMAHILGVRPNQGRRGIAVGQLNLQINNGMQASQTMEMANDQLAGLIGAEVIDVDDEDEEQEESGSEILPDRTESEDGDEVPPRGVAGEAGDGE